MAAAVDATSGMVYFPEQDGDGDDGGASAATIARCVLPSVYFSVLVGVV